LGALNLDLQEGTLTVES